MHSKDMAIGYAIGYNDGLDNSGGDEWVRPSDWPAMPEPEDNQVVMLITTQWNISPYEGFTISAYKSGDTAVYFDGSTSASVDWGDGYSETIELPSTAKNVYPGHYFYDFDESSGEKIAWHNGPVLDNGAHVFVITITLPDNAYLSILYSNCQQLEIYVGKAVKFSSSVTENEEMLEHIRFCGWQPSSENISDSSNGVSKDCRTLQKVTTDEPWTVIPQYAFSNCYALKEVDLSECTEIGVYAFSNTEITEIESEVLHTIGASAFFNCYVLKKVNTPSLVSVGSDAFSGCGNIESIIHAEDWTYPSGTFSSLYRWYDNPEKSHPQIP